MSAAAVLLGRCVFWRRRSRIAAFRCRCLVIGARPHVHTHTRPHLSFAPSPQHHRRGWLPPPDSPSAAAAPPLQPCRHPRRCHRCGSAHNVPTPLRQHSRPSTVAAAGPDRERNRYRIIKQDLLPGGVPNTPTRRLMFRIRHALSLRQLEEAYRRNRVHPSIWEPKHSAAVFMRVARLLYYRCVERACVPSMAQQSTPLCLLDPPPKPLANY